MQIRKSKGMFASISLVNLNSAITAEMTSNNTPRRESDDRRET